MKIFTIEAPEGFEWMLPVDDKDLEALLFDGTPRGADWKPVLMEPLRVDEQGNPLQSSDFPSCSGADMLLCRERAVAALRDVFEAYGELLPLRCTDGLGLWCLNVTRLADALDEQGSKLLRTPGTGKIIRVSAPRFLTRKLAGTLLFKLAQMPRGLIYVTDEFVRLVEGQGLRGIAFKQVFQDDPQR